MHRLVLTLVGGCAVAATAANPASAAASGPGLVPQNGSATFRFATSVKTPKGNHSGSGTITVKRTGDRSLSITVANDDGTPARTIPMIVGVDGSIAPDPSAAATQPTDTDSEASAQAKAFMAQMTLAAHVGIGARKSAGAANYSVPLTLAPVGDGTPVTTQLAMNGSATQYTGRSQGQTMTTLPQGGSLDPKAIAKTVGVSAFAHHAFTPVGRAATTVVMHRKRKKEKEEAAGPLPDAMTLTVTADLTDGRIHEIRGVQTDAIALPDKPVTIESTWSFTKAAT